MRCVLGIDVGGTKTDAILVRDDGTLLQWGHCDLVSSESGRGWGGSGRSERSISSAIRQATANQPDIDELHIAGLIYWFPLLRYLESTRLMAHPVNETESTFALANLNHGVVALSGTGSLAQGKTIDGRVCTLDGLGPLLGDYGSGYHIGAMAVKAAAKSRWHQRHKTSLEQQVFDICGGRENDPRGYSLVAFLTSDRDRAEIASLAKVVDAEANAGDRIAIEIMNTAADALAETIHDVADRLEILNERYPLIGVGSIAVKSDLYWTRLCERVAEFAPKFQPKRLELPPVIGVAISALLKICAGDHEMVRARLIDTAREYLRHHSIARDSDPARGITLNTNP